MTRAVIELSGDIQHVLPLLGQKIPGYGYFPGSHQATFNKGSIMVVMDSKEVYIYRVENEAEARNILEWLKHILDDSFD
jgi:ArsR family metal-binding transcriptional regulator